MYWYTAHCSIVIDEMALGEITVRRSVSTLRQTILLATRKS